MSNLLKKLFNTGDSTQLSLPANVYTNSDYIKGNPPFGVLYQKNNHLHLIVGDPPITATNNIFVE